MPQVQVALRSLAQGKSVRVNDVISYIMTSTASSNVPSSEPVAKRAFAPQDVLSASSSLKPDIEWYLHKQIFPPIERLCAPIPGTDAMHLAECLGLDTRKYTIGTSTSTAAPNTEIFPLESQIPDAVRFKDCAPLTLRCRYCAHTFPFEGLPASLHAVTPEGIVCLSPSCGRRFPPLTVVAQLEHAIRVQCARYYEGWLVCDDPSCGNRTRMMSVYGHRCLGPRGRAEGCLGRMGFEFGERGLYNQLLFFRGLWDVERMEVGGKEGEEGERGKALAEWNRERFGTLAGVVEGYLGKCGRVWVQMEGLFGFALK